HPLDFVYLTSLRGRELARHAVPSYAARGRPDLSPEGACHCPQIYFDPILARHVRGLPGVALRYDTVLSSFEEIDGAVRATLVDSRSGREETVDADFLVGCDGTAGMVRDALGIALAGEGIVADSVNIFFRSPELPSCHDKGWARFYRSIDATGCWSELIPIEGRELWRLTVFDEKGPACAAADYLDRMAGGNFPREIISVSRWERRDCVATSYRHGRVFIAGDAAHQCSPTGGLGMHMGVEEAVNLAWKLAAVLAGWGGEGLLDSYETERRPVALAYVAMATTAFRAIAEIPGLARESEAAVGAYIGARLRGFSVGDEAKIGYDYQPSPICTDAARAEGAPPRPGPLRPGPLRPGLRAPHAWLADGRSILDLFGRGFVLLRFADEPASAMLAAARSRGVPLIDAFIAEDRIASQYGARFVLVRPDGHVAWFGDSFPADAGALVDRARGAVSALSARH
ncbi:MAG: hypothetical protein RL477_1341, partial [Pseudomonadota bacterium]